MRYPEISIAELEKRGAASIQTGPFGTQLKASDYVTSGVPVINVRNIGYGELRAEKLEFISEVTAQRLGVHSLKESDIVFGRKGAVDRHLFVSTDQSDWIQGSDCIRLRLSQSDVEPRFASYAFLRSYHKKWMLLHCGSKATMASLNQDVIRRIVLPFPSLKEQREIVSILSNYDDLIENNRRRIELLEDAARLLYREWFVRFLFPGHEHLEFRSGLPDGWSRATLGKLADDVSYGFTESAGHDIDGPKFLRITDIASGTIDWSSVPRCPISDEKLSRFLLSSGDIVVARTGATTGWARRIGRQNEPAVFASYLVRFRFGNKYRPELAATFMESDSYKAFVKGNLGGAAQPNASAKVLGRAVVPVPPSPLQINFVEYVSPMFEQIDALMEQNLKLAEARDVLLPRLMNGEIVV